MNSIHICEMKLLLGLPVMHLDPAKACHPVLMFDDAIQL